MLKRFVRSVFFLLFVYSFCFSQDNKEEDAAGKTGSVAQYGQEPEKCKTNLSLYKEQIRQKNYKKALTGWRIVYTLCPQSSMNIYKDGVDIMKFMIDQEKDPLKKEKYIDTLLMVYQKRIDYLGQDKKYSEGWISGRMGVDLITYRKDQKEQAYRHLQKSVDLMGVKTEAAVVVWWIETSAFLLKDGKINDEQMITNYIQSSDALAYQISEALQNGKPVEKMMKAQDNIDLVFSNTPPATCDRIIPLFTNKMQNAPNDIATLKTMMKLLDKKECTGSDLNSRMVEKIFEMEPTAGAAYTLARLYSKKEQYTKSAAYYLKAIELEKDPALKADYYLELGKINFIWLEQDEQAVQYARESMKLNPKSGTPCLLLAKIYANGGNKCGDNEFARKTVYWVAVDMLGKAVLLDSSLSEEAATLITDYTGKFPNEQEGNQNNIKAGDDYTVGCEINLKTKARFTSH